MSKYSYYSAIFCIICAFCTLRCTSPVQEEYYIKGEPPKNILSLDDRIKYNEFALSSGGDKIAISGSYRDYFVYEMDLDNPQKAKRITDGLSLPAGTRELTLLSGGCLYLYRGDNYIYVNSIDSSFEERKYEINEFHNWQYRDSCILYSKRFYEPDSQSINFIDINTGKDKNIFSTQSLMIIDFDYHPEKNILAYTVRNEEVSNVRILIIHDLNNNKKDTINTGSYIGDQQFSNNGKYLAWQDRTYGLSILDIEANKLVINSNLKTFYDIQWSKDDENLLLNTSGDFDIYHLADQKYNSYSPLSEYGSTRNFIWTDNNKIRFLAYDYAYVLRIFDIFSRENLYSIENTTGFFDLIWINNDEYLFSQYKNEFYILDLSTFSMNEFSNPFNESSYSLFSGNGSKWILIGYLDKIYLLDLISLIEGNPYYIEKAVQNLSWISWMGRDGFYSYRTNNLVLYIDEIQGNTILEKEPIFPIYFKKIKWAPYSSTTGEYGIIESGSSTKGLQLYFLDADLVLPLQINNYIDFDLIAWSLDGKSIIYLADDYNVYQKQVIYEPQ